MRGADGRNILGTEMAKKYYFVSDLHMGGDGQLQHCDYAAEFIEFLKELEKEDPETELLIVGDTFGFWELTLVSGTEKLDHIIKAHQAIFDQLRAIGARIKVTMMVGNHDYDLACDPAYVDKLRAYNIHLDTNLVLIRFVGDKKIWIEHGQQREHSTRSRVRQSARASCGLLHHRDVRQRGQPAFGLRQGRLAQGHSFGRHDADPRLVPVELFLSRNEYDAALAAAALSCFSPGVTVIAIVGEVLESWASSTTTFCSKIR